MSERAPAGFLDGVFDRTLANLRSAWREIALSARGVLSGAPRPDLPEDDIGRLRLPRSRPVRRGRVRHKLSMPLLPTTAEQR